MKSFIKALSRIVIYSYEEIVVLLFCVGISVYALGISDIAKNIKPQIFFHLGGLLFFIFAFKHLGKQDLKALRVPLLSFVVVIILGLLSYFDEIMPRSFSKVFGSVNTHIINYLVLFVIMFLYTCHAKKRNIFIFLGFFAILCVLEVVATLYIFWENDFKQHNIPFYFKAIYTYNIWLIAPMALCISGVVVCKKILYKIMCALGVVACMVAMLANGERSFLVATLAMVFVPFFVWQYRYKVQVLLVVAIWGVTLLSIIYVQTKDLPERYNFAHMIDNFWEVVHTPPAAMGKYDKVCFGQHKCNPLSTKDGKAKFFWEHSSLSRIAMSKSTFEAFLDNPLKPHIVGVFQIGEYLWLYYNAPQNTDKKHNAMYVSIDNPRHNGYNSPHNFVISLLFSYGIIGFLAILGFLGFVFYTLQRYIAAYRQNFVALWLYVCLVGICVQSFFDVIYPNILEVLFIFVGSVVGFCLHKDISLKGSR